MVKIRREDSANYQAIYTGSGTTIRLPLDNSKEVTELRYPEFYDVGINTLCDAGCPYCYTSALKNGRNFDLVTAKIQSLWGTMDEDKRPFQVAIGGSGEATQHPEFPGVMQAFRDLGIVPNYTTNGRHIHKKQIMDATVRFAGGVAVSCHPHLQAEWELAIARLLDNGVRLNLHCVVGDRQSIDRFNRIYDQFAEQVEYIVMLPLMRVGRGSRFEGPDTDYLRTCLGDKSIHKLAFGSNFYDFLLATPEIPAVLYPPEIMSKYILLDDPITVYNNSFEMRRVHALQDPWNGLGPIPLTV